MHGELLSTNASWLEPLLNLCVMTREDLNHHCLRSCLKQAVIHNQDGEKQLYRKRTWNPACLICCSTSLSFWLRPST